MTFPHPLELVHDEHLFARYCTWRMQIQGLPTMVFVGVDPSKPALRTEGLLPAASIKEIIQSELLPQAQAAE